MTCVFCSLDQQPRVQQIIYRDDFVSILPTNGPVQGGHILLVPNAHYEDAFTMPNEVYQHILAVARQFASILKTVDQAPRVSLLISGMEIPHVHLHLAPIYNHGDRASGEVRKAMSEEMEE